VATLSSFSDLIHVCSQTESLINLRVLGYITKILAHDVIVSPWKSPCVFSDFTVFCLRGFDPAGWHSLYTWWDTHITLMYTL